MRIFFLLLWVPWLAAGALHAEERALRVITLNTVLTEIARDVGGDKVTVNSLMPTDADPHTFDPAPADVRAIVEADLVLASGLNLEAYLERLTASASARGKVVAIGDELPGVLALVSKHDGHDHGGAQAAGERDPHWWHSIDNMLFATERVCVEFTRLRPASAGVFERNAHACAARLMALKAWAAGEIEKIPAARRQLVTSHDAFGYFARDYGFTVHTLAGLSTEGEPDARHLARLIDLLRREKIPVVFTENNVNAKLVKTLVAEANVRLGGILYADGLGPKGSDATTYETMYRHNVRTIVDGLTGR